MTIRQTSSADPAPGARRNRRGSVLILVVALLVLMSLIGTAFIVTARTDRTAARLHTHNAQADMAVQSAVNLVVAELSADLFAPSGSPQFKFARDYRPPTVEGGNVGPFENWDAVGDAMIGPRVPVLLKPTAAPTSLYPATPGTPLFPFDSAGVNPPLWLAISGRPDLPANQRPQWTSDPTFRTQSILAFAPTARPYLGHPLWPFLQVYLEGGVPWDANPSTPEIDPLPAADADGDGIADAELWKLPIGPMNGVTYYAAVRVVDNNSAINVNTALARNFDFDGMLNAAQVPAYFLGRVGLAELLRTYKPKGRSVGTLGDEFAALNVFRNNSGMGPLLPGIRGARVPTPFDDLGRPRRDFSFLSLADALESQLGRRIGNPGSSLWPLKMRPFTLSDSMALGYRFCLADGSASRSAVEQVLNESLFRYADAAGKKVDVPTTPYRADETTRWMERFRYDLEDPAKPQETFRDLRALLVARNPVANQAPARYALTDLNADGDRNDTPGERDVKDPAAVPAYFPDLPGGMMNADGVAIRPYEGIEPYVAPAARPGVRTRAVPPVSVNTARFPELWRGFWSVMAPLNTDPLHSSPAVAGVSDLNPFLGNHFTPGNPLDPFQTGVFVPLERAAPEISDRHPNLMFRSSIRDVTHVPPNFTSARFAPGAQMLLRAALAAVNAEDLRDGDDDVTAHLIEMELTRNDNTGQTWAEKVPVRVYGTERQPFITEVYVNTDDREDPVGKAKNPKGYVAIELHNPYDVDINLGGATPDDGWAVGVINRTAAVGSKPRLTIESLDPSATPFWRFPAGTVVPSGGYLVLENLDPAGADPLAARYRPRAATLRTTRTTAAIDPGGPAGDTPAPPGPPTVFVPNLHRVLRDPLTPGADGGEFVLLRTRGADGKSRWVTDPKHQVDEFDERSVLSDLVPVDQFDFTGADLPGVPDGKPGLSRYAALHYVRANDAARGGAWKFVYPGRYDGLLATSRQQGAVQATFGPALPDAPPTEPDKYDPPVRLGAADDRAYLNQGSFPIQLASPGFGGPSKLGASGNVFPFGIFARQGDILQVPFIGAYTVYARATPVAPGSTSYPPLATQKSRELYEMNSVSMDSTFAEDTDTTDDWVANTPAGDAREQIGRFCPVHVGQVAGSKTPRVDDYISPQDSMLAAQYPPPQNINNPVETVSGPPTTPYRYRYRYRWAADLFDHLTTRSPNNDFLPNVTPGLYKTPAGTLITPSPEAVSNSGGVAGNADALDPAGAANDYAEDLQPVEGLMNINTAPWKVLAALPMVLNPDGSVNVERNAELAKAIVYFRDVHDGYQKDPTDKTLHPHGPFTSVMELNAVWDTRPANPGFRDAGKYPGPGRNYSFRNAYGIINFTGGTEPGVNEGDLAPNVPGKTDGVRGDFEELNLVFNRVSNLITTRSDSFTCYVYVMGVRHDGAPDAEIVEQRRVAFIADRSGVRPLRPVVRTFFFNNE